MAQSSSAGRTIAIAIITLNAVISVLLVMAVVYLFFQVTHLQEENKNLRDKWQKLQCRNGNNKNMNTEVQTVENGKIFCGLKGRRGRPGVKGDRGEKGDIGGKGRAGLPGQPGSKGAKGSAGSPGIKGDPGICGDSCGQNSLGGEIDSPLLHLSGDGTQKQKINNVDEDAVPFWKRAEKAGNISYSKGRLTIKVPGFYYIYSQMAYCGQKNATVGHFMKINTNKVLETKVNPKPNEEITHNVGGIFKLREGDKIAISPILTNVAYCFSRDSAYFGAFLVRK